MVQLHNSLVQSTGWDLCLLKSISALKLLYNFFSLSNIFHSLRNVKLTFFPPKPVVVAYAVIPAFGRLVWWVWGQPELYIDTVLQKEQKRNKTEARGRPLSTLVCVTGSGFLDGSAVTRLPCFYREFPAPVILWLVSVRRQCEREVEPQGLDHFFWFLCSREYLTFSFLPVAQ